MATAKKVAAKAAPKKVAKTPAKKLVLEYVPPKKLEDAATKINELDRKYRESIRSAKALKDRATRLERESKQKFDMPMEVKDWIDQAMSRLKSMQSKVERLEAENKELKSYKRWAEHRILNSSPE